MDKDERIQVLEKALLEYVKTYGFNDAAQEYFIRYGSGVLPEGHQLN